MKQETADPGWHLWWENFVGWTIVETGNQAAIAWMLLTRGEKRSLVIQRTYRGDPIVFADPSDEDVLSCRRDAWVLWNR